jgi:formylglycine-generating enzyme required for sulfatase activity
VLGVILLGAFIYVATDKRRITMAINDPKAVVKIDGEEVRIEAPGATITLRAGTHDMEVRWGDGQFQTRRFVVRRGDNEDLRVEYEPTRNDGVTASREKPSEAAPKPGTGADSTGPTRQITNSIGMKLTPIPAGEFLMGSDESDEDAIDAEFLDKAAGKKQKHRVRITRPFYLGVTEVTRGQFRRFVDEASYQTEAEKDGRGGYGWDEKTEKVEANPKFTWRNAGFEQTDHHPVVNVSWNDAQAFIAWLSRKEGKSYRLPTEAEWEYACRAGTTTRFSFGDDQEGLAAFGNIADATAKEKYPKWTWALAGRDGYVYTAPVGRYNPNAWGLFDMHGNVWE